MVEDASKVTIMLNDRREIDATVVGSDERTDVALLKVRGSNFPELRTGNVDRRVGEPVLAIGSPSLALIILHQPALSAQKCVT